MDDREDSATVGMNLSPYAVHTTLARSVFNQAVSEGTLNFTAATRWASVTPLLEEARANGQSLLLLVSDGTRSKASLQGWGVLEKVKVNGAGTVVTAAALRRLRSHGTQELLLRETGLPMVPDSTLPYALVHGPSFLPTGRPSLLARAISDDVPTLFSFGYEGCGMGTARFVDAVDEVERARGFEPPLWVDARISRKVRALGFREKALERLVGTERYRWMSDLGNEGVLNGGGLKIRRPAAVADLLRLALDTPRRRVIFFCACPGSLDECHRHEVGRLLLRHAQKVGAQVQLVEWPGGEPVTMVFDLPSMSALNRWTLDTKGVLPEAEAAAIPWGSHGILRVAKRTAEHVLLGPALFGEKQTVIRIAEHLGPDLPDEPMSISHQWRVEHGTEAFTVN